MGDARKVQEFIPSPGGVVVAAIGKPARPNYRLTVISIAAAVLFALATAAAAYNWYQSRRAFNDAIATISELAEATAESVQPNAQRDNIDALLERARKAVGSFAGSSSDSRITEQRGRTYLIFAEIDSDRGQIARMLDDAKAALALLDALANSGNLEARHLRARAERLIGRANWELGNNTEAKQHYDRGISDLEDLLKRDVDPKISRPWMRSQADLYQSLGDILLTRLNQRDEALAAYNKARELRERLVELGYLGPALEHDLAWIANKRAEVEERRGNIDEALKLLAEARDRMETLNERIWDNPRWATNFGAIYANIGRLKRKQNRYAEAAPIFTRADEILSTVAKRDPKNVNRNATLNWVRFLRAENLFRLALQNNDRIRLLSAREQAQQIIAKTSELARESGLHAQEQLNKVREEAFLAAIDATLRQLNGNFESAAAGFIEASEIIANGYLKAPSYAPWPDLLKENIEYLEWAGGAYMKAKKNPEAQAMFKQAADMLVKYQQAFGEKDFEEFRQRIEARIDRTPSTAGQSPPAAERAPPTAPSVPATPQTIPPAADLPPPAAESSAPAADGTSPSASGPTGAGVPPADRAPAPSDAVSQPPQ